MNLSSLTVINVFVVNVIIKVILIINVCVNFYPVLNVDFGYFIVTVSMPYLEYFPNKKVGNRYIVLTLVCPQYTLELKNNILIIFYLK